MSANELENKRFPAKGSGQLKDPQTRQPLIASLQSGAYRFPMRTTITVFLLEQAAKCRRLASIVEDREIAHQLLDLAGDYEAKVREDGQPTRYPEDTLH